MPGSKHGRSGIGFKVGGLRFVRSCSSTGTCKRRGEAVRDHSEQICCQKEEFGRISQEMEAEEEEAQLILLSGEGRDAYAVLGVGEHPPKQPPPRLTRHIHGLGC